MGFDVELAWRKGGYKTFPPDGIRIYKIMPIEQARNHNSVVPKGLQRQPVTQIEKDLNEIEVNFLKWFAVIEKNGAIQDSMAQLSISRTISMYLEPRYHSMR